MGSIRANETIREGADLALAPLISFLLAVSLGIFGAAMVLPGWVPGLARSLLGTDPKAYWYLSRGAAFVSLALLWISMALGLLITNKLARSWPGAPAAFAVHEYVSLLGLAFAIFHALVLLGDRYIDYQLAQILVPFGSVNYHPAWVGLGQIGLYVWTIISGSFYIRRQIGPKSWKLIHYSSFFTFLMAMMHGLASGTDSSLAWAHWVYWSLGASLLFLTVYRMVSSLVPVNGRTAPARPGSTPADSGVAGTGTEAASRISGSVQF